MSRGISRRYLTLRMPCFESIGAHLVFKSQGTMLLMRQGFKNGEIDPPADQGFVMNPSPRVEGSFF